MSGPRSCCRSPWLWGGSPERDSPWRSTARASLYLIDGILVVGPRWAPPCHQPDEGSRERASATGAGRAGQERLMREWIDGLMFSQAVSIVREPGPVGTAEPGCSGPARSPSATGPSTADDGLGAGELANQGVLRRTHRGRDPTPHQVWDVMGYYLLLVICNSLYCKAIPTF